MNKKQSGKPLPKKAAAGSSGFSKRQLEAIQKLKAEGERNRTRRAKERQDNEAVQRKLKSPPVKTTSMPLNLSKGFSPFASNEAPDAAGQIYADAADNLSRLSWLAEKGDARAIEYLATLIVGYAGALEELAITHAGESRKAAEKLHQWPVALTLSKGKLADTSHFTSLLKWLGVDRQGGTLPVIRRWLFKKGKPLNNSYLVAAANLYQTLLAIKSNHSLFFDNNKWMDTLRGLQEPMTEDSRDAWWRVAKEYLDEQWETNRECFDFIPMAESQTIQKTGEKGRDKNYVMNRIESGWGKVAKILDKEKV